MSPLSFAWRSLTRQPARALLGIAGIAVVGALLFDMLLVSRGLVRSFRDLLESVGYDVRVTSMPGLPGTVPRLAEAESTAAALRGLPEIAEIVTFRFGRAEAEHSGRLRQFNFMGVSGAARDTWTVVE
jgi:hypothetical protein